MSEFFNWHDTWILVETHWIWMLIAAAVGIYVGWSTTERVDDETGGARP